MAGLHRFSMFLRDDGKLGLFSAGLPAIVIGRPEFKEAFVGMCKAGHPEIIGDDHLEGLGMAFGNISKTGWDKLVSLCKRQGAEIIA